MWHSPLNADKRGSLGIVPTRFREMVSNCRLDRLSFRLVAEIAVLQEPLSASAIGECRSKLEMQCVVPNIPLRAYQLWDVAGRPEGRSEQFYFKAEEEFRLFLESGLAHDATDAPAIEAADANVEAPAMPKT